MSMRYDGKGQAYNGPGAPAAGAAAPGRATGTTSAAFAVRAEERDSGGWVGEKFGAGYLAEMELAS